MWTDVQIQELTRHQNIPALGVNRRANPGTDSSPEHPCPRCKQTCKSRNWLVGRTSLLSVWIDVQTQELTLQLRHVVLSSTQETTNSQECTTHSKAKSISGQSSIYLIKSNVIKYSPFAILFSMEAASNKWMNGESRNQTGRNSGSVQNMQSYILT